MRASDETRRRIIRGGNRARIERARKIIAEPTDFDYSPDQWNAIDRTVLRGTGVQLSKPERQKLCAISDIYLRPLNYRAAQNAKRCDLDLDLQYLQALLKAESCLTQLKTRFGGGPHFDEHADMLAKLREVPARVIALRQCEKKPRGQLTKETDYTEHVINLWVELGGALRCSSRGEEHPHKGKASGPLIDFYSAVAVPVMGHRSLSRESIRNIVRRLKKAFAENANSGDYTEKYSAELKTAAAGLPVKKWRADAERRRAEIERITGKSPPFWRVSTIGEAGFPVLRDR